MSRLSHQKLDVCKGRPLVVGEDDDFGCLIVYVHYALMSASATLIYGEVSYLISSLLQLEIHVKVVFLGAQYHLMRDRAINGMELIFLRNRRENLEYSCVQRRQDAVKKGLERIVEAWRKIRAFPVSIVQACGSWC